MGDKWANGRPPSGLAGPGAQTPVWQPSPSPNPQPGLRSTPSALLAFPTPRPPGTAMSPHPDTNQKAQQDPKAGKVGQASTLAGHSLREHSGQRGLRSEPQSHLPLWKHKVQGPGYPNRQPSQACRGTGRILQTQAPQSHTATPACLHTGTLKGTHTQQTAAEASAHRCAHLHPTQSQHTHPKRGQSQARTQLPATQPAQTPTERGPQPCLDRS